MNADFWKEVVKLELDTIAMADAKALVCLSITVGVIAVTLGTFEKHPGLLSGRGWCLKLGRLSLVAMIVAVGLGVWVTFARGVITNALRGPGLVDPRRIHQWENEAAFMKACDEAKPEDFTRELQRQAMDYAVTMNDKYFWLNLCQGFSVFGWLTAVMFNGWVMRINRTILANVSTKT